MKEDERCGRVDGLIEKERKGTQLMEWNDKRVDGVNLAAVKWNQQVEHQAAPLRGKPIQQFFFCRPAARRQKEDEAEREESCLFSFS